VNNISEQRKDIPLLIYPYFLWDEVWPANEKKLDKDCSQHTQTPMPCANTYKRTRSCVGTGWQGLGQAGSRGQLTP